MSVSRFFSFALLSLILTACGNSNQGDEYGPRPAPEVSVLTAKAQVVYPENTLLGRLEAWKEAEVRARVSGIIESRDFDEGSDVKAGQKLFTIDAAPYKASYDKARADVQRAEARLFQAESHAKRIKALRAKNVVSEQDAIDAEAEKRLAQAEKAAAFAQQTSAKLKLDYATVTAPIDGRIGRALVTEGALVGEDNATVLAYIQQIDPVYVSFTQSANDVMTLRQQMSAQQTSSVAITLILDNGKEYPHKGQLLFTDLKVNPSTAEVMLRAKIANPEALLLPGLPVRVKIQQGVYNNAYLVPQQAVERDEEGSRMKVLDDKNQVNTRLVEIARSVGNNWLVTSGLKDGEKFVVEGFQKIIPGVAVKPIPWKP